MGFWSGLGKGLLGAIPVVGPIVGGIIQGAEESKAAKTAANQQVAATNQAIAMRKPYADTGLQAFQTLSGLMGLGGASGGPVSTPTLSGTGPTGGITRPIPNMGAITDPNVQPNAAQAPGGGGWMNAQTPAQLATNAAASSYPSYTPKTSMIPTVKMQAPDGTVQDVPGDQVGHYTQLGAKVVS